MRTLFITTSYPLQAQDPAGHFVRAEALLQAQQGPVTVLLPRAARQLSQDPIQLLPLPHGSLFGWPGAWARGNQRPWRWLGLAPFLLGAAASLSQSRYDHVVAHWLLPSAWPLGWLAQRRWGCPLQVVAHGSDVRLLEILPRGFSAFLLGQLYDCAAQLRCVSRDLALRLSQLAPARAHAWARDARVEPPRLDTSAAPSRAQARQQLALKGSLVLVIGRLVPSKRSAVALQAASLAGCSQLVVIGDGPQRQRLQAQFPQAHFLGQLPRDQTLTWLAAADLLLSASRLEGSPTVLREARLLGVPVISTQAGDLTLWAQGDPGLWVLP